MARLRLLVALLVALTAILPVWPGPGGEGSAAAQSWTPKGRDRERRYRHRPREKPKKKKPAEQPAEEPAEKPAEEPAEQPAEEPAEQPAEKPAEEPAEQPADRDEDDWGEDDWDPTVEDRDPRDGVDGDDTGTAGDDSGSPTSLRIEDDLDNVGADVDFSAGDLADEDAGAAARGSVTRLETFAMAFVRFGVDTVHDPVPEFSGVKAAGEDVLSFRAHGRAEGTGRFGDRYKVKVAGRVFADLGLDADTQIGVERYEAELWDTYLDIYGDWADLRFGKQIVVWGVADLLSPNDVVNPRDLRRGFLDRPEELHRPTLALSTTAYDGPFSIQGLWIPVAPVNRFELLEGDYALLGPNAATPVERRVGAIVSALADDPTTGPALSPILAIGEDPGHGIETGELGASVALRFRRVDLIGYFLWGHERNPRIQLANQLVELFANNDPATITPDMLAQELATLSADGVDPVEVDYPRRIHVGGAVAGRIEPIGIKLEVGYEPQTNVLVVPQTGAGPLLSTPTPLPQLGVTASLDYDRGSTLTVILEASHVQVFDVPMGQSVYQMSGDQLNLLGTRFAWTPKNGPFSLRLIGFLDIDSPSYAVKPALGLSGHDNLSLEIAATFFGGPQGSYGGVADRNDEILFTVQYGL